MNESLHRRAKEIFVQLVELPRESQSKELDRLCAGDAHLRREVSSLLDFHTARSLMAEPPRPKIRHRSTLSTTRLNKSWYEKAISYLPIGAQLLLVIAVLMPLAYLLSSLVERHNKSLVTESLQAITSQRAVQVEAWHSVLKSKLGHLVANPQLRAQVSQTQSLSEQELPDVRGAETIQQLLEGELAGPVKFCLWNKQMRLLACSPHAESLNPTPGWTPFRCADLMKANEGELILRMTSPGQSTLPAPLSNDVPTAFCPIKDEQEKLVGTIAIQTATVTTTFNALLDGWNTAPSADEQLDCYVVDATGHLLSRTQNAADLKLLADFVAAQSIDKKSPKENEVPWMGLLIRDPGVDLTEKQKPEVHSASWPLTRAVQGIADAKDGVQVEGYRNYVGKRVVGGWAFLDGPAMGLIVERPADGTLQMSVDANRMIALLFGTSCAAVIIGIVAGWPKRRTRNLQSVGPYKIQEMLGEGGMGKVYLAEHSLLCRPTAIKILSGDNDDLSVLMRFEREVQLASQLTHPNTISIYDFGRNEHGFFYYAMEFIDGGHLGQLVEFDGPLPPGRCIYLLKQLCFALREAHLAGVVHRDIKPQNVMLCDRGGEPDFVKLVDYGLVKAFAPGVSDSKSQTSIIIGTPRFMAPERLQSPWLADPRVDIYSIGGLLYYMLTAELPPLVTPTGSSDNVQVGVETLDLKRVDKQFESLLGKCLSHDPAMRPSSIATLLHELDILSLTFVWTREDSEKWWKKRGAKFIEFVGSKRKKIGSLLDSGKTSMTKQTRH